MFKKSARRQETNMLKKHKYRILSLLLSFLLLTELYPVETQAALTNTITVSADGTYKNLDLRYLGDNSSNTVLQGNIAKYYSDIMFNMYRQFNGISYSPSLSAVVINNKGDYDNAVAAVKADVSSNPYITTLQIEKDIVDYLGAQPDFIRTFASIRRSAELGITTLRVTGPWGSTPNTYGEALFNVWRNAFAQGYLYGLAGVTNFNAGNEPDLIGVTNYEGYAILVTAQIDGLKTGAMAALGSPTKNWGPTFASHNTTTAPYLNTLLSNINHDLFDIYDFHQYGSTRAAARDTLQMFKAIDNKPVSMSEYNWILAPKVEPDMGDATNFAKMTISLLRSGVYAPLRFMFTKSNKDTADGQPSSGIVSIDDVTVNATRGTKMYYSSRIINRLVDTVGLKDGKQFQEADYSVSSQKALNSDTEIMIVKTSDAYQIIIVDRETTNKTDSQTFTVDLSKLGVKDETVIIREVSDTSNDEVTGSIQAINGTFTATIYSQRIYLFSIPTISAASLKVPEVYNAFGHKDGIDLWWKNQAIVSGYKVERYNQNLGYWEVLDSNVSNSYYTDKTALPGDKYQYRITPALLSRNGLLYGRSTQAIGPLTKETDLYSLPYCLDFEDGSTGAISPQLDGFSLTQSIDDMGLISPADTSSHSVFTGSTQWTDYSMAVRFHLENKPAVIPTDPSKSIDHTGLATGTKAGAYLRYQDPNNYYKLEYDKAGTLEKGKGTLTLYKKSNGIETILKTITSPIDIDDSYAVRNIDGVKTIRLNVQSQFLIAEIEKNRITVSLGTTVTPNSYTFSVYDPDPITHGKVGLTASNGVVFFDGIRVDPLLTDDFKIGDLTNWSPVKGSFDIEQINSDFYYISRESSEEESLSIAGETYWKDYWFNMNIYFKEFSSLDAATFVYFNYIDMDNFYRVELSKDGTVSIVRRLYGKDTSIATGHTNAFEQGEKYLLGIHNIQGKYEIELNGRTILNYSSFNNSLSKGKIGVGSRNAEIGVGRIHLSNVFQ